MCYCYSTSPSPSSCEGSDLSGGMSSFKPGWLCGSSLDNTWGVFVRVIVDGWAVVDVISVPIVWSTGVLGLRRRWIWICCRGLGRSTRNGGGLLVFQVFWGIGSFSRWFYLICQLWHGIGGWGVFLDLFCPISGLLVIVLSLFAPFEGDIRCVLFCYIALWDECSDEIGIISWFFCCSYPICVCL